MPLKKSTPSKKSSNNETYNNKLSTTTDMVAFGVITIIITVLVIILHYSMHTWTKELENQGCECSNIWHRKIINWLALIFLIFIPINILIRYLKFKNSFIQIFSSLMGFAFITYIFIIIDYIRKLKHLGCKCSENWKREYSYIFSITYISFLSIFLFSAIIAGLFIKLNNKI